MKELYNCKNTGRRRVRTINTQPSKTDQSHKEQCDVNCIIERFQKTGMINHTMQKPGQYIDVSEITDLHHSLIQVQHAKESFYSLGPKVRSFFNNDMANFVEFMNDPKNAEKAIELGLVEAMPAKLETKPEEITTPPTTKKTKEPKNGTSTSKSPTETS